MQERVSLKLSLPRIPDIELVALEGLDRLARHLGIPEDKIGEAKIVVTEALINAFEHAGPGKRVVRVEFSMTSETLVVFVRDYGKGFEPSEEREVGADARQGVPSKRGWGLKLMKSLSDDLRIKSGKSGTTITITKHLS